MNSSFSNPKNIDSSNESDKEKAKESDVNNKQKKIDEKSTQTGFSLNKYDLNEHNNHQSINKYNEVNYQPHSINYNNQNERLHVADRAEMPNYYHYVPHYGHSNIYNHTFPDPFHISNFEEIPFDKAQSRKFIDSTKEILKSYSYNGTKKRHRIKISAEQLEILEEKFKENPKPTSSVKKELGKLLNIPAKNIQIWFQNRRAKQRTEKEFLEEIQDARNDGSFPLEYENSFYSLQNNRGYVDQSNRYLQNTNNLYDETYSKYRTNMMLNKDMGNKRMVDKRAIDYPIYNYNPYENRDYANEKFTDHKYAMYPYDFYDRSPEHQIGFENKNENIYNIYSNENINEQQRYINQNRFYPQKRFVGTHETRNYPQNYLKNPVQQIPVINYQNYEAQPSLINTYNKNYSASKEQIKKSDVHSTVLHQITSNNESFYDDTSPDLESITRKQREMLEHENILKANFKMRETQNKNLLNINQKHNTENTGQSQSFIFETYTQTLKDKDDELIKKLNSKKNSSSGDK
ncbi:hypothetical protein EDEG_02526 [Edhazardia aedis USNM 41457]|uniref:Homeobox domain-containing protein n=1 Tax=Edhazardia aedis (strain USNM 41457) TaxID=1003232 RepID=J9D5Q0_EDHAE|nr:hypothetical protein EDEG_02526 [Edhazardia aedis USNM 41457]|eukprot:EJW03091.1 hypothetical protein EDEG_02526 [Edhazardia aedis USNM 41457]